MENGTGDQDFKDEAKGTATALEWAVEAGTATHRHFLHAAVMAALAETDPAKLEESLMEVRTITEGWIVMLRAESAGSRAREEFDKIRLPALDDRPVAETTGPGTVAAESGLLQGWRITFKGESEAVIEIAPNHVAAARLACIRRRKAGKHDQIATCDPVAVPLAALGVEREVLPPLDGPAPDLLVPAAVLAAPPLEIEAAPIILWAPGHDNPAEPVDDLELGGEG